MKKMIQLYAVYERQTVDSKAKIIWKENNEKIYNINTVSKRELE